jgi:hypothetical protein
MKGASFRGTLILAALLLLLLASSVSSGPSARSAASAPHRADGKNERALVRFVMCDGARDVPGWPRGTALIVPR